MIELRSYQAEGLAALWDYYLQGNKGNACLAWPTGTGKSIVPAVFIKYVMAQWPRQRFLMVTHVKELIQQNYEVLKYVWPNAPVSIYSAGLKLKNAAMPIVYGGIQSMNKHPSLFGHRDIAFVDEAHLINADDSSMYKTFFATMRLINPNLKIIGLTATPFRMGWGLITDPLLGEDGKDKRLFTDIVHDVTGVENFNRLIAEGYLSPLIPLRTKEELDISGVQVVKGEFVASQLQLAVDKQEITHNALKELVAAGKNRKSWLIFASGIEHAEHIAETLATFGITCAAVHSKQKAEFNDQAIKAFKGNTLKAIANYGKLTTGFNHPQIDLIGMLRPTMSVPLWVQMLGRGTRPAEGKKNCLVLDFAKNTIRLGPINDPAIPRKKGEGTGDVPVKLCEACGAYNHARVQFCCQCGAEFIFKNKLVAKSGKEELLRSDLPVVEEFAVTYPIYSKYQKEGKPPCLKITYYSGMQAFTEFQFPENPHPLQKKKFKDWWKSRHIIDPPMSVDAALQHTGSLRMPKKIHVWMNKTYKDKNGRNRTSPEILKAEW